MLELIQKRDELPNDVPPALPRRPRPKGRPPTRMLVPPFISVSSVSRVLEAHDSQIKVPNQGGNYMKVETTDEGNYDDDSLEFGSLDFQIEHFNETLGGRDTVVRFLEEIFLEDDTLRQIVGLNETLDDIQVHQNYHKVQTSAVIVQSFIRGEKSRHRLEFLRKRWVSAVFIQSVMRGWFVRKHFMDLKTIGILDLKSSGDLEIQKIVKVSKGQPWVHLSAVKKIHMRILDAEFTAVQKEHDNIILYQKLQQYQIKKENMDTCPDKSSVECLPIDMHDHEEVPRLLHGEETATLQAEIENAFLKQQLKEFEKICSDYEMKMEMWQKQTETLRTSLETSSHNDCHNQNLLLSSDHDFLHSGTVKGSRGNKITVNMLAEEFEHNKDKFENDARSLIQMKPGGQSIYPMNLEEELSKLKSRFSRWHKAYKGRLREAKTALESSGFIKSRKGCWCIKV